MNSAPSLNYARIQGNNRGPIASFPQGLNQDSPAPANLTARTGGLTSKSFLETTAMTTLGQAGQWLEGVPFGYDACQRLRATESFFSLVMQPSFVKSFSFATVSSPALWDQEGLRSSETAKRELAVDIVIV